MDGIDTFAVPSLGSRVKVAIRCRPAIRSDVEDKEINYPDVVKTVDDQSGFGRVFLIHSSGKSREFIYDHAFGPECDQDSIFEAIAQPVVDDFLGGRNGTLFAYGQTGTGKTHTMGVLQFISDENAGIIPRAISRIFDYADEEAATENASVRISLSFLQLYRDTIQDLLAPLATVDKSNQTDAMTVANLSIREDPLKGFYVEGLQEFEVNSYSEAEVLVNVGLENRAIASTLMNTASSRSHTILTIHAQIQQRRMGSISSGAQLSNRAVCSKLMLVDLAGSERVRRSESQGIRLAEAKSINCSLSALGNVIAALASQSPEGQGHGQGHTHIPYRDTKLTKLLQDSLGGTASTALIATVSPAAASYGETLSTLQFASRCMSVQGLSVAPFVSVNFEDLCADLREEVSALEDALIRQEHAAATQRAVYDATIKQLYAELLESRRLSGVRGLERGEDCGPELFDFNKLKELIDLLSAAANSSSKSSLADYGEKKEREGEEAEVVKEVNQFSIKPLGVSGIAVANSASIYEYGASDPTVTKSTSNSNVPSVVYDSDIHLEEIYQMRDTVEGTNVSRPSNSREISNPESTERVAIRMMERKGMHREDPLRRNQIGRSTLLATPLHRKQPVGVRPAVPADMQPLQPDSESDSETESRSQLLVQPERLRTVGQSKRQHQTRSQSQHRTLHSMELRQAENSNSRTLGSRDIYKGSRAPLTSPPAVSVNSTSSFGGNSSDSRSNISDRTETDSPTLSRLAGRASERARGVAIGQDRPLREREVVAMTPTDASSIVDRIAALTSAQIARMNPAAREQVLAIRRQLLETDRDQKDRENARERGRQGDNQSRRSSAMQDAHDPTAGRRARRPPHWQHRYRDYPLGEE